MKKGASFLVVKLAEWLARHPWITLWLIVGYVLSPVDAIPEVLGGMVGLVDDLFVVAIPLLLSRYLRRKRAEAAQPPRPEIIDTTARED